MPLPGLLIFDCDGVLVDSEPVACRTDAACLAEIGIAITAEEIMDRYVGISLAGMLADLERRLGRSLPAELADSMRERVLTAFETELTAIRHVDGLLAGSRVPRCVASGSEPQRIRRSLSLVGLLRHFEPHLFSASQVARGKPAPDLFLFAAAQMGVAPERCLVIEDSLAGVQAARSAGMPVYGFIGGGHCRPDHAERLLQAGAALVFADMRELPALLAA